VTLRPIDGAYGTDLAYIHDAGHGDMARDAARRLVAELPRTGRGGATIVDLGCGSGILVRHLLDAGYHVIGMDVSAAMIALARSRAPGAEFHVQSFVSAELPRCIAVTAIGEVLNYLFDADNGERTRDDVFRRVYDALEPGGLWLFDVACLERAGTVGRAFAEGPDWAVLVRTEFDAPARTLTRHITTFRLSGTLYRRDSEVHRLALFDQAAVLGSLRRAGFHAEALGGYDGVSLPQGVVAFLGRKDVRD
jgi:SAM-dependent methyltransferase